MLNFAALLQRHLRYSSFR